MATVYLSFFRPLLASFSIGRVGGLLAHAGLHAAALDHEAVDDAVEDGAVVVALLHVGQEVGDRLGRLGLVEFEGDDAVAGDVQFDLGIAHVLLPVT
jgi:hypothetical protein